MIERRVPIGTLHLDGGETLSAVEQHVTVYGDPRRKVPNVLVLHALTGSSRAAQWWPQIAGEGALFDPRRATIVGINALGSCYGSTGPAAGEPFPRITVRDVVRAQRRAFDALGIHRFDVAIGGSLGGMQALQWALDAPERIGHAIVIGAHDHHSAMGIALNAVQRDALGLDPTRGLRLARKIATLTYKSDELLRDRHERRPDRSGAPRFDVEGYLELQADRFVHRMRAENYAALSHAMDSFDVRPIARRGPPRQGAPKLTFVSIAADWLFRPQDVRKAARRFAARGWNTRVLELRGTHGHDAFLAEAAALRALLEPVVREAPPAAANEGACAFHAFS